MNLLLYFQLSLVEIYFIILTVFIASIIRGFNAFVLSSFAGIVDIITIYRIIPLIIILPIGVYIGDKFFVKSKEETYRKVVFYFLIFISILGVFRAIDNF
jgi:uncharacterized membrane protein YfcA